jgi:hypothetical protein
MKMIALSTIALSAVKVIALSKIKAIALSYDPHLKIKTK